MNDQSLPILRQSDPSVFSFSGFDIGQRMARALAMSNLVPLDYQGNLPNCMILLEVAQRMNMSVVSIASNLNIIHGKPTWSATFIASAINSCGLFTPLRFEWRGTEGADAWGCRARAKEIATDEMLFGPWVSIALAKAEGWYARKGSKWVTMPELMLTYRAISFFGRVYASHILSGMAISTDEMTDAIDVTPTPAAPARAAPTFPADPLSLDTPPAAAASAAPAPSATPLADLNAQVRARGRPRKTPATVAAGATGTQAPGEPAAPASGPETPPAAAAAPAGPAPGQRVDPNAADNTAPLPPAVPMGRDPFDSGFEPAPTRLAAVPMPPDHVPQPAPVPPGSDPFF